jgi:hypothetical protein
VPGLAERLFPERPHEDPMLLDALRRSLSNDLAADRSRARGTSLLRLAVGAAKEGRPLWPRVDAGEDGRELYALDVAPCRKLPPSRGSRTTRRGRRRALSW